MIRNNLQDFIIFIREKGVIGLAVGIIIGGAITKLVNAIVTDLINPLIGAVTGKLSNLDKLAYQVPHTEIIFKIGDLISNLIDFIAIAAVVYFIFMKIPLLSKIDQKKE